MDGVMNRRRLATTLSTGFGVVAVLIVLGLLGCSDTILSSEALPSVSDSPAASTVSELTTTPVHYVALAGSDDGDCSTPASACRTIQYVVDRATAGDEIRVAGGVYAGVNRYGGWAQLVYLSKTLTIRGGYTTTHWSEAVPQAYPVTLDAQGQGRVLYIAGEISPTVAGLHITGGDATGLGGGAAGEDAGGGLYVISATFTLEGNRLFGNSAASGGGLYLYDSAATLVRNVVAGNTATVEGGGLVLDRSPAELINNVIAANRSDGTGAGLYVRGAAPRLLHTTLARNSGGDGSGVAVTGYEWQGRAYSSTVWLTNTILVSHTVGITVATGSSAALDGVLWYANATNTSGGGTLIVTQAVTGDPAFASDGHHITPASAALDAGVFSGVTADLDGHRRPYNGAPDLGADELIAVTMGAGISSRLVYTDTDGGSTLVQVPAGAVNDTSLLLYTPRETATAPAGLLFAGSAFDLEAYAGAVLLPDFSFSAPATITIRYTDGDVARVDEDSLELRYWDGLAWLEAATSCDPASSYERRPDENWIALPVCKVGPFATFGVAREYQAFLPLVIKEPVVDPPPPPAPPPAGFARWRSVEGDLNGWERDGVRLAADGRLELDLTTAHTESDPYPPGGYYGHNFYNGGSFQVGAAHSPVMTAPVSFAEAVASWNADTPPGSWVETLVRARLGARWTKWYNLGIWAADTSTVERHSVKLQGDTDAYVAVTNDAEPVTAYQLQLRLFSADDGAIPSVRNLSFAFSETLALPGTLPPGDPDLWDHVLPVPACSQMVYPDGGTIWCSPTSTAMVLEYWLHDGGSCETRVRAAVAGVYDWLYDGHGNWPFNTAYAATYGLEGYVVRFNNLAQVEKWIAADVPVIFSLAWGPGELTGAPLPSSSGHLMVLVGFDADGDPVLNDPAAPSDDTVRRTYLREEFERLWLEHTNGTVYLIYPPGWPVPDL